MFGIFKKLQGAAKELANSSVKAENKDLMEAMVAAGVLAAYADGELSSEEADAVRNILGTSTQLSAFGNEPVELFDTYCDKMEASARMGKLDLLKEVGEVDGDDKARVLIMAIEVADADDNIDDDEKAMLKTIAKKLSLNIDDYL